MKEIYRSAVGGLIVLTGLTGCGSEASAPSSPPSPSHESPEQVEQSVQHSLARLRALQIVEVGDLVLDLPAEAQACYGVCPGWEERYQAERARQAARAERLASLAEAAAADSALAPREWSEAAVALQALAGLQIVEVSGLVEAKPANNPECYYQPCPADIDAADRLNASHVAQVFAVVDAANKTGL
jgi:hypothetical protein